MQVLRQNRNKLYNFCKQGYVISKLWCSKQENNCNKPNTDNCKKEKEPECEPCKDINNSPCEQKEPVDASSDEYNIFCDNAHWIRQLKDGEDDPTHGGYYFDHRMYHRYTWYDVVGSLSKCRQPQPNNKDPLIPPKVPTPEKK